MNTGTSKGVLVGSLLLALSACEDFAALDLAGATTGENLALTNATLAGGTVKLVPPSGFCVDKRSLRQTFALMARCDTLGGRLATDAPLALLTATTVEASGPAQVSTSDFEGASEQVIQREDRDGLALVQVRGTPPSNRMRETYWRAAARIGDQVVGLALYEPSNAPELGGFAVSLLTETVEQTQAQSVIAQVAAQDNSATAAPKDAGNGFLAGLFE